MSDETATVISIFATVLIIIACLCVTNCVDWYACDSKTMEQGLEHKWGPFKGCLIKVDGKWVDYDKWRVME